MYYKKNLCLPATIQLCIFKGSGIQKSFRLQKTSKLAGKHQDDLFPLSCSILTCNHCLAQTSVCQSMLPGHGKEAQHMADIPYHIEVSAIHSWLFAYMMDTLFRRFQGLL